MGENKKDNKKKLVSRRDFLVAGGAVIAAGALSACTPKAVTETTTKTVTSTAPGTTVTPNAVTTTVTGSAVTSTKTVTSTATGATVTSTAPGTTVTAAPVTSTVTAPVVTSTVTAKPWIPAKWDYETDVVVVGTGYAGLAAAIAVNDAKANLIVLEKAPEKFAGGNSSVSVGGNSIWSVKEECFFDLKHSSPEAPDDLVQAMWDGLTNVPAQLKKIGIELTAAVTNTKPTWKIKTAANPNGGPGSELWKAIKTAVDGRGIKPMYETPATKLIQDAQTKEILGVVAVSAGKNINIKAKKGVILACGGYEGSGKNSFMGWYNWPSLDIATGGTPYNTGDGIKMVSEVGAPL